jgi:hypothetical protein
MIHKMHVMHARRAGRHAGQARQAAINMSDLKLTRRATGFQHVLDQVNPTPRRIQLIATQQKRGACGGTHAAMHATPQNAVAFGDIRVSQLGGGEKGLHETSITHNIDQWQNRGR